ncbi:hypothetical protein CIHG_06452 [Coccidioides immitis H538.4]|uniref:Peptidase M20 dimerisation domain-containing protein n=1 Tax=Coccidioides immitis H538.4 TaxID=396776 RepID=A0A0J8RXA9_COCIT|nr:hypothetical protein CIHG_06452 [Coccidioides immitis H538.4]
MADNGDLVMIPEGHEKSNLDEIIASSKLLSLHRSLSEIESISNNEGSVGDFLVEYLESHGFTVQKQAVPLDGHEVDEEERKPSRFNVYAYPASSPSPEIILTSHIDTVPPYIPYSLSLPPTASTGSSSIDRRASTSRPRHRRCQSSAWATYPSPRGGLPSSEKYGQDNAEHRRHGSGVATNVVPASASARVAVRLAETILAAVRSASKSPEDVHVSFSAGGAYPPVDLDSDVEGFDVMTVNYGTDVPNWDIHDHDLPDHGKVKRYLYGPGSIFVAHGENEGLSVGDMEDAVEGYARLIRAAVGRSERK